MIFYAIRQISTGHFMPNYGSRKGRGGWTNDTPQSMSEVAPRLFVKRHLAATALKWWLKGETWQDIGGGQTTRACPERQASDMEIVIMELCESVWNKSQQEPTKEQTNGIVKAFRKAYVAEYSWVDL